MPDNFVAPQLVAVPPAQLQPKRKDCSDFPHRWMQYAAAALGVTSLTAATSAQTNEHHILYTPANITVDTGVLRSTRIPIDLNHDGIVDLSIVASHFRDSHSGGGFNAYGRIWLSMTSAIGSRAIPKGMIIDKAGQFRNGRQTLAYAVSYGSSNGEGHGASGPFANITNKYLGVRITVDGKVHEGWIRMTLATNGYDISGHITGYAYDTVPSEVGLAAGQLGGDTMTDDDKSSTLTPSRGSLGMLALGSSAISYWRK